MSAPLIYPDPTVGMSDKQEREYKARLKRRDQEANEFASELLHRITSLHNRISVDPSTTTTAAAAPPTVTLSDEQQHEIEKIRTNKVRHAFFSGQGGVGKSELVKALIATLREQHSVVMVTASTGCAATLIRGSTLHGCICIGHEEATAQTWAKNAKRKKPDAVLGVKAGHFLVVDEVSMISAVQWEKSSELCQWLRNDFTEPFGGLRVIAVGDFGQLPPVFDYKANDKRWAFQSDLWKRMFIPGVNIRFLLTFFRQSEEEVQLRHVLQCLRRGYLDAKAIATLRSRQITPDDDDMTNLMSKKEAVKLHNERYLAALPGEEFTWHAHDSGDLVEVDKQVRAPKKLTLKVGARIMLIANIDPLRGLSNGQSGVVTALTQEQVTVKFDLDGRVWKTKRYPIPVMDARSRQIGERVQMPFILAAGLTGHKAQGATMERAKVHTNECFERNLLYTMISRVRSLKGLFIAPGPISAAVKYDPNVVKYEEECIAAQKRADLLAATIGQDEMDAMMADWLEDEQASSEAACNRKRKEAPGEEEHKAKKAKVIVSSCPSFSPVDGPSSAGFVNALSAVRSPSQTRLSVSDANNITPTTPTVSSATLQPLKSSSAITSLSPSVRHAPPPSKPAPTKRTEASAASVTVASRWFGSGAR